MTNTILASTFSRADTSTPNTTQYVSLFGFCLFDTAELDVQTVMRTDGKVTNLHCLLTFNSVNAVSTFTFRKNGVDATQTLSIGANGSGDFEDVTNTDIISTGDKINVKTVPGAATGIMSLPVLSSVFTASQAATITHIGTLTFGVGFIGTPINAGVTRFFHISAETGTFQSVEANVQLEMRRTGIFKNPAVNITTNNVTANSTYTFRVNGADSIVTASITASTTGFFEDLVNSVTVAVGDKVNHQLVTGATGTSLLIPSLNIEFDDTNNGYAILQCGASNGVDFANNAVTYQGITGGFDTPQSNIGSVYLRTSSGPYVFSDLSCLVTANTNTDNGTVSLMIGLSPTNTGNNIISLIGSTTGYFTDITNSDIVNPSTYIQYKLTTGVGSGGQITTIQYFHIAYTSQITRGAAGGFIYKHLGRVGYYPDDYGVFMQKIPQTMTV